MKYFGSSGIRGIYGKEITPELALDLGRTLGSLGKKNVAIARDTRVSGRILKFGLLSGLMSSGCAITSFGIVPTPVLCYGTRLLNKDAGVMITASHNPAEYNGFKLWNSEGRAYSREEELKVESLLDRKSFVPEKLEKLSLTFDEYDVAVEYSEEVLRRIQLMGKARVLLDAANGAAFGISPLLLQKYNHFLVSINDTANGLFPNRNPEPIEANLGHAINVIREKKLDIGFCHDGDADRVVPIDNKARVVDFDKFLAFMCKKSIEETGNKRVVTTVDASSLIDDYLPDAEIVRTKVGDVFVANKCEEINACFGGEPCGAFIFPEFGLWPDGIYAIPKVLKFLEDENRPLSEIMDEIPSYHFARTKIICPENKKDYVMNALESRVPEDAELLSIDGLRIHCKDYTALIRPSGTEALIRINVEAKNPSVMKEKLLFWQGIVKNEIASAAITKR
jgi:phosphoglucosamine mutase